MNQDTTYSQFLEEQDALDAMLWEGLPIPFIQSCADSQDMTGLGVDPNIDLTCTCHLESLYCLQHGVYRHTSTDIQPPPSLSNLEQTAIPFYDVPRPSQHVPQPVEFTDRDLMRLSSSHNQCEIDHPRLISPKNDRVGSASAYRGPPISSKALGKQSLHRSKICSDDKRILRAQFSINPYPGKDEVDKLHRRTGLAVKCIRTWFSNSRYRTAYNSTFDIRFWPLKVLFTFTIDSTVTANLFLLGPRVAQSPQETQERQLSETPSQVSTSVSAEGLKELGRISPAHSTSSLERYLATPLTEEAIPSIAVQSLSETYSKALGSGAREELGTKFDHVLKELEQTQSELGAQVFRTMRRPRNRTAGSVAGSSSSLHSGSSVGSWTSQNSVRSRDSRRGRKRWVRAANQSADPCSVFPETYEAATIKRPKGIWYCTSPDCDKSFQYRCEWDRHEAAVHHWPYRWMCGAGTDPRTVHKNGTSCIFFRQDQFLAHVKRAHPEAWITKGQALELRENNPDFNPASLKCGFCHRVSGSWEERQDHVGTHMQKGSPKSSWLCWEDLVWP